MTTQFDKISANPFQRLRKLIDGIQPSNNQNIIDISLGEPQNNVPEFVSESIEEKKDLWGKYPPLKGTPSFRQSIKKWLDMRYNLNDDFINSDLNILPVSGTRAPLYLIASYAVSHSEKKNPCILIPETSYHVYTGATIMAGADPVYIPIHQENSFLPTPEAVDKKDLERATLVYFCSPSNPHGTMADFSLIEKWLKAAQEYNFLVLFDECYSEIYRDQTAIGAIEVCQKNNDYLQKAIIVNSLSKRSGVPGLRSGFFLSNKVTCDHFSKLQGYGATLTPLPILAAAEKLWQDEAHVAINRDLYRQNFHIADDIFSSYKNFKTSQASFFLWLDVNDGEYFTKELWAKKGIKVLPGAYMTYGLEAQKRAMPYIRIALIHDAKKTANILNEIKDLL